MAKVILTFDTVDKTAVATIDGAEVPNFSSFNVYMGYKGKANMEITSGVEDEQNDMRQWTRVCASENDSPEFVDKKLDKVDDEEDLDEATKKEVMNWMDDQ